MMRYNTNIILPLDQELFSAESLKLFTSLVIMTYID